MCYSAVESVTDSGSSGAAPGPGPSSAEAVPGASTHATESVHGSCIELIPAETAPKVPFGVEAYPGYHDRPMFFWFKETEEEQESFV
ncbi:hypothetical protein DPMN_032584 [Dreissena polymorpha]|uniref:Uncharacterized protein n=1 Tax=Dreissena polymorpha TaxID=45954 RepID=A0A9D4M480_DREPO|nr:hypothetical protein DPMN_032584 [Dreissena polymorpha]